MPGADLLLEIAHRAFESRGGVLVEARHADVADIAFAVPAHLVHRDDGARQRHVERLLGRGLVGGAQDGQRDLGADLAAHLVDRVVEVEALHRDAVDRGDIVAGLQAGARGGRIVDRRNDLHQAVLHRHFDADAAERALGLDLHVGERLGVHVAGMRIEAGDHAVDRGVDELAVIHRADIFGTHRLEGVAEEIELAIGVHVVGAARRRQDAERRDEADRRAEADECIPVHDLFAFLKSRPSWGRGLTARPFCRSSKYSSPFWPICGAFPTGVVPCGMTPTGSPAST